KWRIYHDYEIQMLDGGNVLPIFMARPEDRMLPALFKLEGSRVVSGMVRYVSMNGKSPENAAHDAMAKSTDLMQGLPTRSAPRTEAPDNRFRWLAVVLVVVALIGAVLLFAKKPRAA